MENKLSKDICCEKCPLQFGNRTVFNMHMALVHKIEAKATNIENLVNLENVTNIFSEKTILYCDT